MDENLQFQEPQYGQAPAVAGPSGLMGLVIKWGLARDERQAQMALLIILGVAVLATIGLFIFGGVSGPSRPPVPNIDGTYGPQS